MKADQPAYLVGNFTVIDEPLMAEYAKQAGPLVGKFGGRMVLAEQQMIPVEGAAEPSLVIIQFPNFEAAQAFYLSPEYVPVKELRLRATTGGFLSLLTGLPSHQ